MTVADEGVLAALGALETAVNAYLRQDPDALRRLGGLSGKVVAVELISAAELETPPRILWRVFVLPGSDGVSLLGAYAGEADTTLRGTPGALARLGLGDEGFGTVFTGEVQIDGDLELGQRFKRILDNTQFDWEEALSRLVGDTAAHRAGRVSREGSAWAERAKAELSRNTGEFLQEELRVLPTRAELDGWLQAVDTVRDDCARLEARIARLSSHLSSGPPERVREPSEN